MGRESLLDDHQKFCHVWDGKFREVLIIMNIHYAHINGFFVDYCRWSLLTKSV